MFFKKSKKEEPSCKVETPKAAPVAAVPPQPKTQPKPMMASQPPKAQPAVQPKPKPAATVQPTPKAKAAVAVVEITQEAIAQRAKEIWEKKGRPVGQDEQNWREAEAELRAAATK